MSTSTAQTYSRIATEVVRAANLDGVFSHYSGLGQGLGIEVRQRLQQRMASAELRLLQHTGDIIGRAHLTDYVRLMPYDDDQMLWC